MFSHFNSHSSKFHNEIAFSLRQSNNPLGHRHKSGSITLNGSSNPQRALSLLQSSRKTLRNRYRHRRVATPHNCLRSVFIVALMSVFRNRVTRTSNLCLVNTSVVITINVVGVTTEFPAVLLVRFDVRCNSQKNYGRFSIKGLINNN